MRNLSLIFSNTIRLLKRNRTFQIFSGCSILLVGFIQYWAQFLRNSYFLVNEYSSLSEIAHLNASLFGILMTLVLIALSIEIYRKNGQKHTLDAIYCRPTSNLTHVWGKALGLMVVALLPGCAVTLEGMIMNSFCKHIPFSPWTYLFCWFTLIIPLMVFVTGCSFMIAGLIRNRILSLLLASGLLGFLTFYTGYAQHGLWDITGKSLPNAFSDIMGYPGIDSYLLQRSGWLMLGLGMIQLSVISWERLPNNPAKSGKIGSSVTLLLTGGILLGIFWHHEEDFFTRRSLYRDTLERHINEISPEIEVHEINYEQEGETIQAQSRIVVINRSEKQLDNIVLYLNPGLKVSDVRLATGEPLTITRDLQVITINYPLAPTDSVEIRMQYAGTIDEAVGYLDIPDATLKDTGNLHSLKCRPGRRFALVGKDFTWLVPEMMWYPMAAPTVNPFQPYSSKKYFTKYTLQAKVPDKKNIISQGQHFKWGGYHIFRNEEKRPGISLCIGDFQTFRQTADSVNYTFYCSPQQAQIVKQDKKSQSEWEGIIIDKRLEIDHMQGIRYPYKRFTIVELPRSCTSYYRYWKMGSEFAQPEIMFTWEKTSPNELTDLFNPSNTDYLKTWKTLLKFKQEFNLSDGVVKQGNPYYISPLYYDQLNHLHSPDFPILGYALSAIIRDFNTTRRPSLLFDLKTTTASNNYLEKYNLKEIATKPELDPHIAEPAFTRKIKDLVYRLELTGIKAKDLVDFIKQFQETSRLHTADYAEFKHEFNLKFHQSPDSLLHSWYTDKGLATFLAVCQKVPVIQNEKYASLIECSVFNSGLTDGIVCLQAPLHPGSAAFRLAMKENRKTYKEIFHVYSIKAGTGKRITLLIDSCERVTLDMNLSYNLPTRYDIGYSPRKYPPSQHEAVDITREDLQEEGVVIADNSDPNFRIIKPEPLLNKWYSKNRQLIKTDRPYFSGTWETWILSDFYGLTEKSCVTKLGGKGYFRCEWEAELPADGVYEIFVFTRQGSLEPLSLEYTVFYEDKQEKVDIIPTISSMTWISLGEYSCKAGKNKVYLSDKGEKHQIITADAVKWVRKR